MGMIYIIGAGLAGLSAAVSLATSGRKVAVFESASHAGGRCRSYHGPLLNCEIDNGNHLLLKANPAAHAFLQTVGCADLWQPLSEGVAFHDMRSDRRWKLKPPCWAPRAPAMEYARLASMLCFPGRRSVAERLNPADQLYQDFILPLTHAALNTPADQASARQLAGLMRYIWKHGLSGVTPYVSTTNLHHSTIDPALCYLKSHGVDVYYRKRVQKLELSDALASRLVLADQLIDLEQDDRVLLACPASEATKLVPDLCVPDAFESIINGHFICEVSAQSPQVVGITHGLAEWIMRKPYGISTTTSAANRLSAEDTDALAQRLWREVCRALQWDESTPIPPHRIIYEKRATFLASAEQLAKRPPTHTAWRNLFLAGDYVASPFPGTIESAVRSGKAAAQACISA